MLPVFYHAFHFTGDGRSAVGKYFKVAAKAWPDLLHVEPKLLPDSKPQYAAPQSQPPPCEAESECMPMAMLRLDGRKIRVGFASAFFSIPWSPVVEEFGGMLGRLSREKFDVAFIDLVRDASRTRALSPPSLYRPLTAEVLTRSHHHRSTARPIRTTVWTAACARGRTSW